MTTATPPEYSGWNLNGDCDDLRHDGAGNMSVEDDHLAQRLRPGQVVLFTGNKTGEEYGYARVDKIESDEITFAVLD